MCVCGGVSVFACACVCVCVLRGVSVCVCVCVCVCSRAHTFINAMHNMHVCKREREIQILENWKCTQTLMCSF